MVVYEVEVKVAARHGPVRERLEALDADPRGAVVQVDTYYDHPSRSFATTDEACRLRRETPSVGTVGLPDDEAGDAGVRTVGRLTYKGPLVDDVSKTRSEVETAVDDPDATDAILRSLGFSPVATVKKRRERFACGEFTVTLDVVEGLGEFVEVEAAGEERDVEPLRDGAFDLCHRLGFDPTESVQTSYLELLLEGREPVDGR